MLLGLCLPQDRARILLVCERIALLVITANSAQGTSPWMPQEAARFKAEMVTRMFEGAARAFSSTVRLEGKVGAKLVCKVALRIQSLSGCFGSSVMSSYSSEAHKHVHAGLSYLSKAD